MAAVALLFLLAALSFAQDYRGRIEGLVTDQSNAAIVGCTVTLTNVKTGVQVVRKTSDSGLYVFDLVDPGTYTVAVEAAGFGKFTQENILVQTRGDITVNAVMKPGALQDSVTVDAAPVAVEFNSANREMTIDSKLANEIPRIDRNPFKLTLIAPSAVNTRGEMLPYHSWAANSVDLGGGTNLKNDIAVDGMSIGMGQKNSTPPNQDAVQEVNVSTNSVDAESGHSAGGAITVTTKAGTNEFHGTAAYLGRYPWLSAMADRTTNSFNAQRQHMWSGTLGNPIKKNKLFNFFSYEYWKVGSPNSYSRTVPTTLEQGGDFSQSLNSLGGLRTIYDPWTSTLGADGTVVRQPFPGNKIPSTRFDPLTGSLMKQFWGPNNPGEDITGTNNFKKGFNEQFSYYNFSERADYNINDKWKVFGRLARYNTTDIQANPTPNNSSLYVPTGTSRAGWDGGGDVIWTASPRTVVEVRGNYKNLLDAYVSDSLGKDGWASIWPNNPWYQPYLSASTGAPVYFPNMNIGGSNFGGNGFYWNQHPKGEDISAKIARQQGSHYLKAGFEQRRSFGLSYVSSTTNFYFPADLTANTLVNPNLAQTGDPYATFLLGALNEQSQMIGGPVPDPHVNYYGMYFQDDWKLSPKITLNLGLRYEYESALYDPAHNFSRGLDLNAAVPEMQATPPQMPAQALSIVGNDFYKFTGQWQFTSSSHPGMYDTEKFAFQPRIGIAYRVNDKTALRFGYARYLTPYEMQISLAPVSGYETVGFLEPPYLGMTGYQNTLGTLQGVPQETFSNPYPASTNPLLPIKGTQFGGNLGRGGQDLLWYDPNQHKGRNDRFNFQIQRQLPNQIVLSGTYFLNIGNQQYTKTLNQVNPQWATQYASTTVDNPFYHYLNPTLVPGPLYNQPTVPLSNLLRPYPQYGGLYELGVLGAGERYHSVELKAQKAFSKGYNFIVSYVYIREKEQMNGFTGGTVWNQEAWASNDLQWQDSNQPRHRFNIAGTWELPFGHGKAFAGSAPKAVDALIGGWKLAALWTYMSGDFVRFSGGPNAGNMIVTGSPCVDSPSFTHMFNTSVFQQLPAGTYVPRTNPLQYDCVKGPRFWTLDGTLTKSFNITERVHAELHINSYNVTNRLNRGDPSNDVTSATFGQTLHQGAPTGQFGAQTATYGNQSGRQSELGLKVIF